MTHKCMGESWYCSCPATCTFAGRCGKKLHFCDDCKEKYDLATEKINNLLANQRQCEVCGEGCGLPSAFDGLVTTGGNQICASCAPEYLKGNQ